ncbi:MAG: thymidine kinase [Bacilli bacterium]|nr:thymidine kinase [Bacilli bacterium]
MAKLYFRYGTMNSGKTALLLQAAFNYEQKGMKVFVMKPKVDTKGGKYLVSRIGLKREVDHLINEDEDVYQALENKLDSISCIFVDEAQFLSPIQVDQLMQIVIKQNIPVICYGLRTDFQTKGFLGSPRLLEIAHTIEELKTICDCGRKAIFNVRMVNGKIIFSGDQVAIDGNNQVSYDALCAKCYYQKRREEVVR